MCEQQVKESNKYFNSAEKKGANVMSFDCLGCGFTVKSLAPEAEGEVWDSMTFCPNCDKTYFKIVTNDSLGVKAL